MNKAWKVATGVIGLGVATIVGMFIGAFTVGVGTAAEEIEKERLRGEEA